MAFNDDSAPLLVRIEASQAKIEKQLASIAAKAAKTAKGVEDDFAKANGKVGRSFDGGGKEAEKGLGRARAAAANLSFQLNDIATGLAGGLSPFQIMAQQGGQVAQIMQQVTADGAGARGALTALGGAITGLLNPVSLASVALIGLTGMAVKYFSEFQSGGKMSEEEIKKQDALISRMRDSWRDTLPALDAYIAKLEQAERLQQSLNAATAKIRQMYQSAAAIMSSGGAGGNILAELQAGAGAGGQVQQVNALAAEWVKLQQKIEKNTATLADFRKVADLAAAINGTEALRTKSNAMLDDLRKKIGDAAGAQEKLNEAQHQNVVIAGELVAAQSLLKTAYGKSEAAGVAAYDRAREWASKLYGENSKLVEQIDKLKNSYD